MFDCAPQTLLAPETAPEPCELSASRMEKPAFLMNVPFSLSADHPNNAWMEELSDDDRRVNKRRALVQFLQLYRDIASEAIVYLLPTPQGGELQDLAYTANLGVVFEHEPYRGTTIISNFTTEPRRGETDLGVGFFRAMGYPTYVAPRKFEGDAELKHLHDNIYIGGYGIRSEPETYDWMERNFDMRVLKVQLVDPYLYHLDCSVFPITREDTLVCTELFEQEEIEEIERYTNIIPVSVDACYSGICNSVRLGNSVLNASHIHSMKAGTQEYAEEIEKNRALEDVAVRLALDVSYFDLSEYHKSGALLSCMIMHINRFSYELSLL